MRLATGTDVALALFIALLIFAAGRLQARALGVRGDLSILLTLATLALAAAKYTIEVGSEVDSVGYYMESLTDPPLGVGTDFMYFFTSLFTLTLGMDFLPTMMAYSAFAVFALHLFYATFMRLAGTELKPIWFVVFLALAVPSAGFWGSGISKDGLALLGVAIFCWALTKEKRSVAQLVIGTALLMIVRPHMGILMVFALGFAIAVSRDAKPNERILVTTIGMLSAFFLLPLIIDYVGFGDVESVGEVNSRVETYTQGYAESNAYVNISELPFLLKLFTYLFRPLPWEASSMLQLAAAAQNMVIFGWLILMFPDLLKSHADRRSFQQLAYLSFGVVGLVLLSLTTANLAISVRQKWMILFPLLFAMLHAWTARSRARNEAEAIEWAIAEADDAPRQASV